MQLNLTEMSKVEVDADAKTVTVFGGAKLGQMDAAYAKYGLATTAGSNPVIS